MAFLSGKVGSISLGSRSFAFSEWKVALANEKVKVTNFHSQGFQQLVSGITSAVITASGPYDRGNMPVSVGVKYQLVMSTDAGFFITVGAIVTAVDLSNDVEGSPQLNITADSDGVFSTALPGNS